jgi:hypothetical protein
MLKPLRTLKKICMYAYQTSEYVTVLKYNFCQPSSLFPVPLSWNDRDRSAYTEFQNTATINFYVTLKYGRLHYDVKCSKALHFKIRAAVAQSVQRLAIGWTIGVRGFDSRRGLGIFLFSNMSRLALGATQPSIQWVPWTLSQGIKRPGREADNSPPSNAEVKNTWRYASAPQHVFMLWWLVRHRGNFTFTFTSKY